MSAPEKIEKAIEISDAKIQFVSLVDKAANKRQFLITKADTENGEAHFTTTGKILKADSDTHYVTGIVYEPLVEDAHGNYMTEDEIRKAAYWFAKNGDKVDLQHSFEQAKGISVVESYVTPGDTEIGGQPIAKGTWVMTAEVENNDVWDKIQKGEITGFSMGGVGKYAETETSVSEAMEKRGLFKRLAEMFGFGLVEKEKTPEKEVNGMTNAELEALVEKSVQKALAKAKEEAEAEREPVDEPAPAPKPQPEEEPEEKLTEEKVKDMIKEAIQSAKESEEPKKAPVTKEDVSAMVTEAVEKAVEPVLKSRGLSSNLNGERPIEKRDNQHYLAGIL